MPVATNYTIPASTPIKTKIDKFGFEIEGEMSDELANELKNIGVIKTDGSLRSCQGLQKHVIFFPLYEYNSEPIARAGLYHSKKIFEVFNEAYKKGQFHWNKSCGFHIHISFRPKFPPEILSQEFNKFMHEAIKAKYKSVFENRGKNRFCLAEITPETLIARRRGDRYVAVNFDALRVHKTIEIRIFPAAKPLKMYEFLRFTIKTIEKFIKMGVSKKFETELEDNLIAEEKEFSDEAIIKVAKEEEIDEMINLNPLEQNV